MQLLLNELSHHYGNWDNVSTYFHQLNTVLLAHSELNMDAIFEELKNEEENPPTSK